MPGKVEVRAYLYSGESQDRGTSLSVTVQLPDDMPRSMALAESYAYGRELLDVGVAAAVGPDATWSGRLAMQAKVRADRQAGVGIFRHPGARDVIS